MAIVMSLLPGIVKIVLRSSLSCVFVFDSFTVIIITIRLLLFLFIIALTIIQYDIFKQHIAKL